MNGEPHAPTGNDSGVEVEHVLVRGYVLGTSLWPRVSVVLTSGTNISAPTNCSMDGSLFQVHGLLNQGDQFILRVTEKDGEVVSTVTPDPNAQTRSAEERTVAHDELLAAAELEIRELIQTPFDTFGEEVPDDIS